jgi:hypothetical protein
MVSGPVARCLHPEPLAERIEPHRVAGTESRTSLPTKAATGEASAQGLGRWRPMPEAVPVVDGEAVKTGKAASSDPGHFLRQRTFRPVAVLPEEGLRRLQEHGTADRGSMALQAEEVSRSRRKACQGIFETASPEQLVTRSPHEVKMCFGALVSLAAFHPR